MYLVEISLVVLEIQKAEFGNFMVPVNTHLCAVHLHLFFWPLTHYCASSYKDKMVFVHLFACLSITQLTQSSQLAHLCILSYNC